MNQIKQSIILLIGFLLLFQAPAYCSETHTELNSAVQMTIIGIAIVILIAAILSIVNLNIMLMESIKIHDGIKPAQAKKRAGWMSVKNKLTGMVPIERERDILLHHDYDGIQELDNNLPPWWLYGFYFTIVFGFIYIGYYHYSEYSMTSEEEYEYEVKQAKIETSRFMAGQANAIDEDNIEALTDPESLAYGELVFNTNCIACHLKGGAGSSVSVGPNLTDEYWIHGGDVPSIFNTIKYGVPEKGMIAWKAQLSNSDMHKVTSYITSLQGTNTPEGKEPQGEKYISDKSPDTKESI